MLHIALHEPEIPPNTGNIIRLCANTGAQLHLIEPFGFRLEDKQLRRAGLDYHEFANLKIYTNLDEFLKAMEGRRVFACSTHGTKGYHEPQYQDEDVLLMGPETRGLPKPFLKSLPHEQVIKIPMLPTSRSLNLSNATAIILMEAMRQLNFPQAVI